MMKSIGICIPTYKRPIFLRQCIESAVHSANGCPIEIYVADDSVSDINRDVLDELCQKYSFIKVFYNKKNLGIDENIKNVVDLCACDYAWIIGEDDIFLPNAIERVWNVIQKRSDQFIFSAYQYVSEDHSQVSKIIRISKIDCLIDMRTFVAESLWAIGFIGAVIVSKESWKKSRSDLYAGTYFTHVGQIVDMISNADNLFALAEPGVANRAQGADVFTWKKDSFGVFTGFERMCEIASENNENLREELNKAIASYRRAVGYLSFKTTFRLRYQGSFDIRQFKAHLVKSKNVGLCRKIWLLTLALTPRLFLSPFAELYMYIAKRRMLRSS